MATAATASNCFRLATVNVHFFQDLAKKSNVQRLIELFKPMSLDLLALQEVLHNDSAGNESFFQALSNHLQLPYRAFAHTSYNYGNGLLSRYPVTSQQSSHTQKISNHTGRAMLTATIDHPFCRENDVTFHVTHLDQISEHVRLEQWNRLKKQFPSSTGLQLMVGDFNALTFDDYSSDYFNRLIRDVRQENGWEFPVEFLTETIKADGFEDCWRTMNPDAKDKQAVTCAYNTRIDYIWKRGVLKSGWKIDQCQIISTNEATDHNGILISFKKDSSSE